MLLLDVIVPAASETCLLLLTSFHLQHESTKTR